MRVCFIFVWHTHVSLRIPRGDCWTTVGSRRKRNVDQAIN